MGDISNVNEIDKTTPKCCNQPKLSLKMRELLTLIIKSVPELTAITDCEENGDMSFSVNLKDLGMASDDFVKYKNEFFSNYTVDFLGELLLRENLSFFADRIVGLKTNYYMNAISHCLHKRFGMKIGKGVMTFYFHISLLKEIITEDFKR